MSFISQTIVFVLALIGICFKSIKTDENGQSVHSRFGLLVLTKAGKIIVTLLILSFLVSMLATYQSSKEAKDREKALSESLAKMTNQNGQLLGSVTDQSKQNLGEFEKQRNKLVEVTHTIDNSAGTLLSNLRNTSNILGSRLDTSIGLLEYSQKEIERAGNPINNVYISFSARVPLDSAPLRNYLEELSRKVDELLMNYDFDRMKENHVRVIEGPDSDEPLGVTIERGSPLLPDPKAAPYAFSMLNAIHLQIDFFKTELSLEEIKAKSLKPDLTLRAASLISPDNSAIKWAESGMKLKYSKLGFVLMAADDIPVKLDLMERTSKITSILDLKNVKVLISLGWGMLLRAKDLGTNLITFAEDFARIKLTSLRIRMSGGLVLRCDELAQFENDSVLPAFTCILPQD